MAFENLNHATVLSFPADEDLTADQWTIVVLDATSGKVRRPNAATDIPLGFLQNAPKVDEEAVVALIGPVTKVVLGATLARGVIIGMEYVGAADAGKAIAAVATMYPVGILLEGGAEDELVSAMIASVTVKA